jgi:hypothetical protein
MSRCPRVHISNGVRSNQDHRRRSSRNGSALAVVLVVIVLLSLSAYSYTQVMLTELEAASQSTSELQARHLADSGTEYAAALLANRSEPGLENLQQNPDLFRGVVVSPSSRSRANGRFTLVAPLEQDTSATRVRYGLIDESAKLNLNVLDQLPLDDEQARTWLMGVPGMTENLADAIRDWVDSDETLREYGAESETYQSMSPPYSAKNGPLETIDELLLVYGVTPLLLYGEDANRNGLLDPNENDGELSAPMDNADGALDLGWVAYLTVYSREANLRSDGRAKINLNNDILADLYDQLDEEFGTDVASFVVGMRQVGASDVPPEGWAGATSANNRGQSVFTNAAAAANGGSSGSGGSNSGGNSGRGGSPASGGAPASSGGRGGSSSGSGGTGNTGGANGAVGATGGALGSALAPGGLVTRAGMDLTQGGPFKFNSLWDLFGTKTNQRRAVGNSTLPALASPWDPASTLEAELPALIDALTLGEELFLEGRVNINQARREVLQGIPGMTVEITDSIINAQGFDPDGVPSSDVIFRRSTTGWLYFEKHVPDVWTMRALEPYITARGDVYRVQSLGFFDGGGPVARVEAVIDGTEFPPRVVFQRDLQELGRGYTRMQLLPLSSP